MKQLMDGLVYLLVRTAICLVQTLRMETCQQLARVLAVVAADGLKLRGRVVDENLRASFPAMSPHERCALTRRMWEHLLLMVCEIAHAPRKIHDTNWRSFFELPQKRELVRFLLDPRPKVLVSGHFGNFEITSYVAGLLGFSTHAIARSLDNRLLDRYVNRFRSAQGAFILPKEGSSAQVDAVLRAGGLIALLGDQHAGSKGCWAEFLGRPASCHKAVALFTLVSGAPLMVTYGRRIGRPLHFELGLSGVADPLLAGEETSSVPALTRWYNQRLEEAILRAPDQYWWVHRRWKGEPPQRLSRAAGRRSKGTGEAGSGVAGVREAQAGGSRAGESPDRSAA